MGLNGGVDEPRCGNYTACRFARSVQWEQKCDNEPLDQPAQA